MAETTDTVLGLTAQIVSAHVSKNAVEPDKLPDLIRDVYRTLASVGEEPAELGEAEGCRAADASRCSPITSSAWKTARR